MQPIRPRLPELDDDDEPIIPSTKVFRQAPPSVSSGKPKSRFAQQREREKATRFELNLEDDCPRARQPPNPLSMLKEVTERTSDPMAQPFRPLQPTGFPQVQKRDSPAHHARRQTAKTSPQAALSTEIDSENRAVLEGMSEEEILEEQQKLLSMLGSDMADFLVKRQGSKSVRFNDDVAFSNPPSQSPSPPPSRTPILLPSSDDNTLGNWLEDATAKADPLYDEGTPEDLRSRFFPQEPMHADLGWMKGSDPPPTSSTTIKFDLQGKTVESASNDEHATSSHRHAGGEQSFSLPELLQLSQSAVASQRALSLEILRKAAVSALHTGEPASLLLCKADSVNAIVAACSHSLADRQLGVIHPAISILEIYSTTTKTRLSTVAAFLTTKPPIFPLLGRLLSPETSPVALPSPARTSILSILDALVSTPEDFVSAEILETPNLLENLSESFLQVPWPPTENTSSPDERCLDIFASIASRTRINAETVILRRLEQSALRFLAIPPWTLPTGAGLALASSTLTLLRAYANYGLGCAHLAASRSIFRDIELWVARHSLEEPRFSVEWFKLLEAWSLCAIDPHSTTPEHDILWAETQEWGSMILETFIALPTTGPPELLRAVMDSLEAWLRGAEHHKTSAYQDMRGRLIAEAIISFHALAQEMTAEPLTLEKGNVLLAARNLVKTASIVQELGETGALLTGITVEEQAPPQLVDQEWT